eukprot:3184727-Lingulodinium_polyedra.AAC.1
MPFSLAPSVVEGLGADVAFPGSRLSASVLSALPCDHSDGLSWMRSGPARAPARECLGIGVGSAAALPLAWTTT